MPLRPACPGTEIARAPHSRRARDLRGVGSPEGSGLFGRRPAVCKEAGAAPAVSRCMGQQGAVARGGGLGRPPSRSARQAERARGTGSSRQAEEDICTYCGAGLHFVFGTRLPTVSQSYTPPSMEDGPTRTHTLHTIGSGADTRHAVTGRSTGSGLLDTQHTAHRTAHEVALYSGVLRDRHRRRRWGTGTGHRTHELISQPAPGAVARASAGVFGPAVWQAPGHRSAGRAFKPHPRSAPALRRDPARC